jgi:uncharacterized protein YjbI with pentapeptide repeats
VASRRSHPRAGAPAAPRLGDLAGAEVRVDPDEAGEVTDARVVAIDGDELDDLELTRCVVEGVRLTARSARRLRLTDVVLRDCELSGADLQEARLSRVRIERCRAEGLDAGLLRASDVVVVDTKLTDAGLRMTGWERCSFECSDLRRVELLESTFQNVEVSVCDLTGADLTRCRLSDVRFPGSRLDELVGAPALAGATIDPAQLVPVALGLFAALGIRVGDDERGDEAG